MPCFNSASFVGDAIESVIGQTLGDWELIVVDDHSVDNTVEIVKSYQSSDPRIKLLTLGENQGAAGARNAAINLSQGRYIAFLDSDDWWRPEKLSVQLKALEAGDARICFASYEKADEQKYLHGLVAAPAAVSFSDLLKFNPIGCSTAIYDTVRCGGKVLMPSIRKRQDYGLWLRLLKDGGCAIGLEAPLAFYRVRRNSVSSNKFSAALYHWKVLREEGGVSVLSAAYYFCFYAVRGLKVHSVFNRKKAV